MQEPLQLPVTGRIMRGVHGIVVLAEELGTFPLGQVAENNRRVIRVVNLDKLGGHAIQVTPGPDAGGSRRTAGVAPASTPTCPLPGTSPPVGVLSVTRGRR
jgi:hypothetical protein